MIRIQVIHSSHPTDATWLAADCLNRAGVHHHVDGETIFFIDHIQLDRGVGVLESAGFKVRAFSDPPEAQYK
jgi:hypothetical protein